MKKKYLFVVTIVILSVVLCYSLYSLIKIWLLFQENNKTSKEAINDFFIYQPTVTENSASVVSESTAFSETQKNIPDVTGTDAPQETDPTTVPPAKETGEARPDFNINWEQTKKTNEDIVGWIWMADSTINYPLLQSENNSDYLKTAYNGEYSSLGSIFLDYRVSSDFTDRNTVIYGHNGNYGIKFGALLNFKKQNHYDSHKYFYILTRDQTKKYEIFSAYLTDDSSDSYSLYFQDENFYQGFLNKIFSQSLIKSDITLSSSDKIVTLSTCTNNKSNKSERFVVHGRQVLD